MTTVLDMPKLKHKFRRDKLREIRIARGWNETELAAKAGVTAMAIRNWENGARSPGLLVYVDLCEALGVDLWDLLDRERSQKP